MSIVQAIVTFELFLGEWFLFVCIVQMAAGVQAAIEPGQVEEYI